MALFASGAEVYDDLHEPSRHNMSPYDYAAFVFNHLSRGFSWTWASPGPTLLTHKTQKTVYDPATGQPTFFFFTYAADKLIFGGLDDKNRPLPIAPEGRTVPLLIQIKVNITSKNALIANIHLNNENLNRH